jgi:D-arabinose 1-dehydrogenase-like Zn-dependent alcohol dehydrogenase
MTMTNEYVIVSSFTTREYLEIVGAIRLGIRDVEATLAFYAERDIPPNYTKRRLDALRNALSKLEAAYDENI